MTLSDFVVEWRKSHENRATKQDLKEMEKRIMALLDDILTDVEDEETVEESMITLLTNLSAAIAAAGTDPVKLAALKAKIDADKQKMADAVVANTPAAP